MSNIKEIKRNVWQINLKPFDTNEEREKIEKFQEACINKKVFGIGWLIEGSDPKDNDELSPKQYANKFAKISKRLNKSQIDNIANRVEDMRTIGKGDYIFTRLRNGNYYVGCVDQTCRYYSGRNKILKERLSFFGKVKEWVEVPPVEMASEVVGRFSQRFQGTITRIGEGGGKRYRFLMYAKKVLQEDDYNLIKLNEGNFVSCLNPDELEDLVGSYIMDNNKSFQIVPSSCKTNTENIEYIMVDNDCKTITLQVKNKQRIDINNYLGISNNYEKIYLFSGAGYDNKDKLSDNKIILIDKKQLWEHINDDNTSSNYIIHRIKDYYDIGDSHDYSWLINKLNKMGLYEYTYLDCEQGKGRMSKKKYYIDKDNNCIYIGSWRCFYDYGTDTLVSYDDIGPELKQLFKEHR